MTVGDFKHVRTTGEYVVLRWDPPEDHETTDRRSETIPLHDSASIETLTISPAMPTLRTSTNFVGGSIEIDSQFREISDLTVF